MSNSTDPFSLNVIGVSDLVESDVNKNNDGSSFSEGLASDKYGILTLDMKDEELLLLKTEWEKEYAPYGAKIKKIAEKNKESYLGKRANGQWISGEDTIAANLQFEAEETFLPAALAKNPEPVVYADNTEEGNAVSGAVKTMLQYHTVVTALRRKLKRVVRQWSINHLGVLKHGWDDKIKDISTEKRKIQDFIFDKDGYVDEFGHFVGYLGERITTSAEELIALYPDNKEYITLAVDGKLGTKCTHTEWWTDEFCFVTFKEKVLDKHKNQYFNYEEDAIDPLTGEPLLDDAGQPLQSQKRNHFAFPKKPYTFLSEYSLQEQPHDITGLIEQNIPNQNLIRKRVEQIDYNISASNNGYGYSEDNFNEQTAKQASEARAKGQPILIPSGGPADQAIVPLQAQSLPADAFNELENNKNALKSSWGVSGILSTPQDEDTTARGMILNQAHDTSRIGGGIGEAVEQMAETTFNWWTQLYYVFYDEQHFAAIMGRMQAVEYQIISSQDLDRQLVVTVSPDSMRPRDDITNINLAQSLFDKGAIGPKTLLKMIDFPDPDEAAADGVLYSTDPMAYLQMNWPDLAAQLMQAQQQKTMMDMQSQTQGAGMTAAAEAGAVPPEQTTEPAGDVAQDPASAALSQVQLPAV